ncbi:hypothetical protein ACFFU1_03690 [Algibacter miyuki]|uniref:Cytochrome C oxidase subunit I n=1 Tax=Algibacter miyuki TaxID=1306933 RepID=A0ABV5GXR3_9FLAO|nr:hypothetical protein [Algibacter miyuki]MDN3664229.1 hypothetical protein [Algibacter miyuki]
MPKKLVVVCLFNFLIAALMGLALRYSFLDSVGLNYRFLTHAHSHIAMLGWVYLMLYTAIVYYFVPEYKTKPIFTKLFWLTEVAVVGMMLSFPFQGYAAVSISFSTLHIFCSYAFVYCIWKHHKTKSAVTKYLLKASLVFMVLSTIGVWCLGPAVSILGSASAFYQIAIQFFLHFQFNGWFLLAIFAVFFHLVKVENTPVFKYFFWTLIVSTVLTFALPIQWFAPHPILLWINGFGVVLQFVMLFLFLKLIPFKKEGEAQPKLIINLYRFAVLCFAVKTIFQLASLVPEFSNVVYGHRNFVIGFIHLLMLGVVSSFLFSFILKSGWLSNSKWLNIGVYSFLLGFILTEVLLLVQGCKFFVGSGLIPNYYLLLFLCSVLLPFGIGLFIVHVTRCKLK